MLSFVLFLVGVAGVVIGTIGLVIGFILKEKREELVNRYNEYLSKYGKDHVKTRYMSESIRKFDEAYNKEL